MRNDSKRTGGLISRFLFAIVLCVMIAPVSLSAQQADLSAKNTVKGLVVDNTGEPLMGAGVVVKGTSVYDVLCCLSDICCLVNQCGRIACTCTDTALTTG